MADAVITGIGLVTPLGGSAGEVIDRILRGEKALQPAPFASPCPSFAPVAARLAMQDSGVVPGALYPAEEIALYGATGLSGMPPPGRSAAC